MIIFLDVDGVFTSARAHAALAADGGLWRHFDPVAIRFFQRLYEQYPKLDIKLVCSSTWRNFYPSAFLGPETTQGDADVRDLFRREGLTAPWHEDWRTGATKSNRASEIVEWLNRHPEVTRFLVVDDSVPKKESVLDGMHGWVCTTHSEEGMTTKNYRFINSVVSSWNGEVQRGSS